MQYLASQLQPAEEAAYRAAGVLPLLWSERHGAWQALLCLERRSTKALSLHFIGGRRELVPPRQPSSHAPAALSRACSLFTVC